MLLESQKTSDETSWKFFNRNSNEPSTFTRKKNYNISNSWRPLNRRRSFDHPCNFQCFLPFCIETSFALANFEIQLTSIIHAVVHINIFTIRRIRCTWIADSRWTIGGHDLPPFSPHQRFPFESELTNERTVAAWSASSYVRPTHYDLSSVKSRCIHAIQTSPYSTSLCVVRLLGSV